jgi:D-proline reductase (dithiol) PrdB
LSEPHQETFEEFRRSFNYGSRTDLLFKFLGSRDMSDGDAAEFFRGLLEEVGNSLDTGDWGGVVEHVYSWQVRAYSPRGGVRGAHSDFNYETTPWAPLRRPLSKSRLVLVSAGGLFVEGDDPMGPDGPTQAEAIPRIGEFIRGAPTLSVIPRDTEPSRLRVRHPGYDIRGTLRDRNVVFPIDRLKELEAEGVIGELAEEAYSFVGASSQLRLLAEGAPAWAERLKSRGVDAALLVAARPVCHVSVGHTARVFEEAGVSTVCVYIRAFRHQAELLKPPRTLITHHILGRTVGAPGAAERQREVVRAALGLLESAQEPPAIVELPEPYRAGSCSAGRR